MTNLTPSVDKELPIVERAAHCERCCNTGITWRDMQPCDCPAALNWEFDSKRDELREARTALLAEARRAGNLADGLKQAIEALEAVESEISLDGHVQELVRAAIEDARAAIAALARTGQ